MVYEEELLPRQTKLLIRKKEIVGFLGRLEKVRSAIETDQSIVDVDGTKVKIDLGNDKTYRIFLEQLIGGVQKMPSRINKREAVAAVGSYLTSLGGYIVSSDRRLLREKAAQLVLQCFDGGKQGTQTLELCRYPVGGGNIRPTQRDVIDLYVERTEGGVEIGYTRNRVSGNGKIKPKENKIIYSTRIF